MSLSGIVFDIQRWSIRDGHGIRTNVFLKGCPLRCLWCSNPESQKKYSEVAFFPDKCIACRQCVSACPHGAIQFISNKHHINREICFNTCYDKLGNFECTKQCYAQALKKIGEYMTVEEVMSEVLSDKGIYELSNGGVTFTGGEPFSQPEFLLALLRNSKENGIHTTIETCCYAPWEQMEKALAYTDFVFADLKVLDTQLHRKLTGVGNELILDNLIKINQFAQNHELTLVIRIPVIPNINDREEQLKSTAEWVHENLTQVKILQLLEYHRLGRGKYNNIGRTYQLDDVILPSETHMKRLREITAHYGFKPTYEYDV